MAITDSKATCGNCRQLERALRRIEERARVNADTIDSKAAPGATDFSPAVTRILREIETMAREALANSKPPER